MPIKTLRYKCASKSPELIGSLKSFRLFFLFEADSQVPETSEVGLGALQGFTMFTKVGGV